MLRVRSPSLFIPADSLHSLPNSTSPVVLKRVLVLPLSWCCLRPRNTHLTAGGGNFVNHPYSTLPPVQSFINPILADWPENRRSALVRTR